MNWIARIISTVLLGQVTRLINWVLAKIIDYIQARRDDRRIDEAFKNPNRADAARNLDDLFNSRLSSQQ